MASPSHTPFSTPDAPGDATVVLVLLEGSGATHNNWSDIRSHYLPQLLEALRTAQPDAPVQIIWQFSADPYDEATGPSTMRSTYSEVHRQIPDFRFDPSTTISLSPAALRHGIETLRANVPRNQPATRHLVVVAMSQPLATGPRVPHSNVFGSAENWQSIAMLLYQDRVRLHMILHASPQLDSFRDFFQNMLAMQSQVDVPPWFQVNPRHTIHLSAQNILGGGADSPTHAPSSAPPSVPVTPNTTVSSLPLSSPAYESSSSGHTLSASPPNRRSRPKPKEAVQITLPPSDAPGPQLVNYIKQIHGLTKRRTPGGKAAKKSPTADQPRAGSSRPILPRLELSTANTSTDPKGKATERAILEAASSGGSRYTPIAPALAPTRSAPPDDGRRTPPQSRRWPWLQPAPTTPPTAAEEANLSPSAAATLRNLQAIAPRMPVMGTQLPGERQSPPRRTRRGALDSHTSPSEVATNISPHRQATYHTSHSVVQGSQDAYNTAEDPQMLQTYEQYGGYHAQQYAVYMPMAERPGASSPPIGPSPSHDDPENQPFVITPEYEALANAEFAEAVRSGAMQVSMTPAGLSPVVTSPGMHRGASDYFTSDLVGSVNILSPPSQQQTPPISTQAQQSGTGYGPYHPQHGQHLPHDVLYYHSQAAEDTTSTSPPSNTTHYYKPNPPPGSDPSHPNHWYG